MRKVSKETQQASVPQKAGWQVEVYGLLHDLIYILLVVTVLFVLLIRLVTVSGPSMTPTLLDRDYVAVLSNVLYREPKAGDIIVARVPTYDTEPIVKRVIATDGQTVDITYDAAGVGTVWVDGVALEEPYINEDMYLSYPTIDFPVTVPEDHVYVMGDNRNHSADSRWQDIGVFHQDYILGKALLIVWPGQENKFDERDFSRMGAITP